MSLFKTLQPEPVWQRYTRIELFLDTLLSKRRTVLELIAEGKTSTNLLYILIGGEITYLSTSSTSNCLVCWGWSKKTSSRRLLFVCAQRQWLMLCYWLYDLPLYPMLSQFNISQHLTHVGIPLALPFNLGSSGATPLCARSSGADEEVCLPVGNLHFSEAVENTWKNNNMFKASMVNRWMSISKLIPQRIYVKLTLEYSWHVLSCQSKLILILQWDIVAVCSNSQSSTALLNRLFTDS